MRILRYIAFALGGLAALLVAAGLFIYATFDAARFKTELTQIVRDKKQRELAIDGDIDLSFWPPVGVRLGRTRLSERASQAEFAAVDSARVSLALLPLLTKQVVIDRFELAGVSATLLRGKDGKLNIDDLLAREEQPESQAVRFEIASIALKDGRLAFRDEVSGRSAALSALDIATGRIANAAQGRLQLAGRLSAAEPALATGVTLSGDYSIDLDQKRYALSAAELRLNGDLVSLNKLELVLAAGRIGFDQAAAQLAATELRLTGKGMLGADSLDARVELPKLLLGRDKLEGETASAFCRLAGAQRAVEAKLDLAGLQVSPKTLQVAKLALGFDAKLGTVAAKGAIDSPLTADLQKQSFEMPGFALDLDAKAGAHQLKARLASPLSANLRAMSVGLPKLAGELTLASPQMSTKSVRVLLDGELLADLAKPAAGGRLAARFDETTVRAKLNAAKFVPLALAFDVDVDRINVDRYLAAAPPDAKQRAAEQPIDLSALKNLDATGSLRIGALQASGIKASNVKLEIKAANGKLELAPHSAGFYDGTLAGSLSADANGNRIAAKGTLTNFSIDPLLRDLAKPDLLEGRGNLALDIATGGATVAEMRQALAGNARISLRDGAIKGINITRALREHRGATAIKSAASHHPSGAEKTEFSEMSASFRIADGVARSDDLSAKSPLLRLSGAGAIRLGEPSIDYLAKATVVGAASGQAGKELASLKGMTLPVRLSGPFDALAYQMDFTALAGDPAAAKPDQAVPKQAQPKVPDQAQAGLKDGIPALTGR